MKDQEKKQAFSNLLEKIINLLSKFNVRIANWINELKYYRFMNDFGERDDDIWVATYMKSGTTLTQMMLYQLTTDGNMDFRHINDVCPWVRNAAARNLTLPAIPNPRIIKTHDPYSKLDRKTKGKIIFVIRDGMDLAVSLYHHRKNYNFPDLTLEVCFKEVFQNKGETNWFEYTKAWLENKKNLPILYLKYEDIINDFEHTVSKVVQFCNLKVTPATVERAKERCGFDFMKKHESKFGVEQFEDKRVFDQFIRKGKPGEGKEVLSENQSQFFREKFNETIADLCSGKNIKYPY